MKIGVIVDNEYSNDIRVSNECNILSNNGHEVKVLCLNFGKYPQYEEINDNLSVYRTSIKRKKKNILFALTNTLDLYSLWWSAKIKKFIIDHNIDAIHVHDLYMAKAAYRAVKNTTVKFTLDLHENYPYAVAGYKWMQKPITKYVTKPWKWKKKESKFLSFPDNIIVLSEEFKNEMLGRYKFLKNDQIVIFPNVPDIDKLLAYTIDDKILSNNQNDFILFYFGAISKRRGIGLLFDSINELSKLIPNVKLLLIGPVDKAEKHWFESKLSEITIKEHIIHYPWKDISLLPSYISGSNICLSPIEKNPQHESGIANKVFQYMLFKKPVIVSDCKPQAFVVNNYDCGLVFQWDSVESFNNKVIQIYKNPESAIEMGEKGKAAVIKFLNNTVLKNNLLNIYT